LASRREFNRRELKGLAIVAKGGMIRKVDEGTYLVRSSSLDRWYCVSWNGKGWTCDCEDYQKRHRNCKHIYAIFFLSRLPFILMANYQSEGVTCPRCGSHRIIRKGFLHNKGFAAQRYFCKDCRYRFSDKGAAKGLKGNPLLIVVAADLYFKGLSYRMIADHLRMVYAAGVSYSTVYRWVRRFISLLKVLAEHIELKPGKVWHVDETEIKVSGKTRYVWNVIDEETRLLLASILTVGRSAREAEAVLREALKNAGVKPERVVTDGLISYKVAMRNLFENSVEHIYKARLTDPKNNNLVERLHQTIKGRIKACRRINSDESASQLLEGFRLYYNFLRPHSTLRGEPPAKKACSCRLKRSAKVV